MDPTKPHPMPPEVQRAYREKLNLQQLFSSPALRDWKHRVMQRFLREIVKIRGNTEVTLRPDNVIVDVASLAENRGRVLPEEVISAVCAAPDYGGKEPCRSWPNPWSQSGRSGGPRFACSKRRRAS